MTHVTCRLTAKNRDQLRNSTLGNGVWATFLHITFELRSLVVLFPTLVMSCVAAAVKPGACPAADDWHVSAAGCSPSCRRDSDCRGTAKCCDSVACARKVCHEPQVFG